MEEREKIAAESFEEAPYRAVIEGLAEMICRFRPDGTILFASAAYAKVVGATPEKLAGGNFWEFVPAEERKAVEEMLNRLTPEAPEVQIENRLRTASGERWTLWTNRALKFDEVGRWAEAQSAGIDITDRKRMEEALRESEERSRRLVGLLPVAVYMCEASSGVISFFNEHTAELWACTPQEGETDEQFFARFKFWRLDGDVLPYEQTPMSVALREGREIRNETVVIRRPDGSRIRVLANSDFVRDSSGCALGAIVVLHDTTLLHRAEEVLRQRHAELRRHAEEMVRFNRAAVGREVRMIELKKEVNDLCERMGQPRRYSLEFEED